MFCVLVFGITPLITALLVPLALAVFTLSMLIGHFLGDPLRALEYKAALYRQGANVTFRPDGRLHEADCLAEEFATLAQTSERQLHDLQLKEKRQAEFVSDVAHELKTPLTAIRGNAEILSDPDLPPALHEKFCNIIVSESERLSRLTHDLLTLQRLETTAEAPQWKRINLHDLAENVLDTLKPILDDKQAQTRIVGEAPDVLGDPDKLKQALTNLVENASRFIEPEGHIDIELYGVKDRSVITVRDNGCGFGDIDPTLLFDRFYRTDFSRARGKGGTGLGLAIVKSIVEAHDGSVEAINLPEGGACFIVALPALPAA